MGTAGACATSRPKLIEFSLCLINHHTMKESEAGGFTPRILNLSNRWRWLVSLTLRPPYFKERSSGIHWVGYWI